MFENHYNFSLNIRYNSVYCKRWHDHCKIDS